MMVVHSTTISITFKGKDFLIVMGEKALLFFVNMIVQNFSAVM